MRVFLSLPMTGRSENEVRADIQKMIAYGRDVLGLVDADYIHNYDCPELENKEQYFACAERANTLHLLGNAIKVMGSCNLVLFKGGYGMRNSKGCEIEFYICREYDIPNIDIPDDYWEK